MRKIPTLFVRDRNNMGRVTSDINPSCQWVIDGEGVPTRKYDGTCVMFDGEQWWTRREVKARKSTPDGFVAVEHDDVTGKTVGWEPAAQSSWFKYLREAITSLPAVQPGTYELIGPKINGNPEDADQHRLISHATAEVLPHVEASYDWLSQFMPGITFEGIVWHHPDGRMAKLKRRDFPPAGEVMNR